MDHWIIQHWQEILDNIKEDYEYAGLSFLIYLKPLIVLCVDDKSHVITLGVPSGDKYIPYMQKKHRLEIKHTIRKVTGTDYDICFVPTDEPSILKDN